MSDDLLIWGKDKSAGAWQYNNPYPLYNARCSIGVYTIKTTIVNSKWWVYYTSKRSIFTREADPTNGSRIAVCNTESEAKAFANNHHREKNRENADS